MGTSDLDVVTGAFGYTGKHITERLLGSGRRVRTLTGHPNRSNPFGERVSVARYEFKDRAKLAEHLAEAKTSTTRAGSGSHAARSPSIARFGTRGP